MTANPVVLGRDEPVDETLSHTRHATLYPVVDGAHRLAGVTTRHALLGRESRTVADATTAALATCHPDDTLREIANKVAAGHVTQALVVDRADPRRVCGVISLAQHAGRVRGIFQYNRIVRKGPPAWLMHRGYHVPAVPTWERKVRVLAAFVAADRTGDGAARRDRGQPANGLASIAQVLPAAGKVPEIR
ncbi:CBS domain-containing protein [Amycolatopsis sp. CA-128772]|uniref:CBS domain-containing protein n=1 Tax=Amycolatopsis sp. CA-128772 TaxID=2073159 RepID=UPI000CD1F7C0|nr:CBS domain-containing protein [Amycolatopsis sp. CA-128772]